MQYIPNEVFIKFFDGKIEESQALDPSNMDVFDFDEYCKQNPLNKRIKKKHQRVETYQPREESEVRLSSPKPSLEGNEFVTEADFAGLPLFKD